MKRGRKLTVFIALAGLGILLVRRPETRRAFEEKLRQLLGPADGDDDANERQLRFPRRTIDPDDIVDVSSWQSFPASDPPSTW
jgi:hypothetical protein